MQMNPARRLAEAVGSWLHLEFCCYRAGLFSEAALKAAVGQMLSSFPISKNGVRVYSDFPHAAINIKNSSGRKKEVDFALTLKAKGHINDNCDVLVEAKWANSTHCTDEKIFTDFLRLAIMKRHDPDATCIFLMAGTSNTLSKKLVQMPFQCRMTKKNTGIGKNSAVRKVSLDHLNVDHKIYFTSSIKSLHASSLDIPTYFLVRAYDAHPIQSTSGTVDFQARTWEIMDVSEKNIDIANWP